MDSCGWNQCVVLWQILPGIQNTDPAIRNQAVKSLGLCCLRNVDLARERIVLLLQVICISLSQCDCMTNCTHMSIICISLSSLACTSVSVQCLQSGQFGVRQSMTPCRSQRHSALSSSPEELFIGSHLMLIYLSVCMFQYQKHITAYSLPVAVRELRHRCSLNMNSVQPNFYDLYPHT